MPRAHPTSAKLNINLRSVVVLHSIEEDRAIRLAILVASTLGCVKKILIIGRTKVRASSKDISVGRYELPIKVLLILDGLALDKAWI